MSTTLKQVLDVLERHGQLARPANLGAADAARTIRRLSPDESASDGSLSWISPKNFKKDPSRVAAFAGTALICPAEADTSHGSAVILPCRTPKLAFSLVVDALFPELLAHGWAPAGTSPGDMVRGDGCDIAPGVVFGAGVRLGRNVRIGPNCCIAHVEIGDDVTIGANCSIGLAGFGYEKGDDGQYVRFPHLGRIVIGDRVEVGSNTCIDRGALGETTIGAGVKIDNLVHIAHNVWIGNDAIVIANSMIGGSTRVGPRAWLAPSASLMNQITIGADAVVGMGAVVIKSVAEGSVSVGNPAKPLDRGTTK